MEYDSTNTKYKKPIPEWNYLTALGNDAITSLR